MPEEKEQQTIENENNKTGDELLALKKELADEIVDKLLEKNPNLFSILFKKSVSDYLVNENTFEDILHDEFLIGTIGKEAGLITPALEDYRNRLKEVQTKEKLDNLKTEIFKEIGQENTDTEPESRVVHENREPRIVQEKNKPTTTNRKNKPSNHQPTDKKNRGSEQPLTNEKAKVDTSSDSYEIDHFNITVSPETKRIRENLKGKEKPDLEPFSCALKAYNSSKHLIKKKEYLKYLTIVDFSKKKGKKRFFVVNMENYTVEHAVKVGHGKKSGNERAKLFSNRPGSHQSSLGLYMLPDVITKSPTKGWYGLRMVDGLEYSNSNAAERHIAVHQGGENGSEGCFTLPKDVSRTIMEKIKGGFLFAYAKSKAYFSQSKFFKKDSNGNFIA